MTVVLESFNCAEVYLFNKSSLVSNLIKISAFFGTPIACSDIDTPIVENIIC